MSVFGEILFLSNVSGTIVFVAVMIFLTIFEALLHSIEEECAKRGYKGLIKKLYREFMIMGFISFAILLGTESSSSGFSTTNQWYQSFHLAHIVILFIGITFLCQAILLVSLISLRNKTLLSYGDSNPEKLALEYIQIHHDGGFIRWFFDHGLITIPFPQVRERIEYKMLQEFFINFYNLPREFKFANYMCQALKDYIISLVEVRPITWIILVALIALNYLRIISVDRVYQHKVCERYPAKNLNYGVHRLLGGGSSSEAQYDDQHAYEVCNEYTLRYVFFCSMLIVLYLLGVFIASEIYIQRLIDKVLDVEETIEKEEDRIAAEEMAVYDIDDLHDRDPSVVEDSAEGAVTHTNHQSLGPGAASTRPLSLRRQVSAGSTNSGNNHIRRTGSNHSLDSLPSLPGLDVECGPSEGVTGIGGGSKKVRLSVASHHRSSLTSQMFGGYYTDEDHHGYTGVTQALHGIVMGKNRRHLYLHCIQRMIQTEEEVTQKEARRMSIDHDDDHHHPFPTSTSATSSAQQKNVHPSPNNRSSLQSVRSRGMSYAPSHISEIYDQHFGRHHLPHNNNHHHPSHSNEDFASPSPPQHHNTNNHVAFREPNPSSSPLKPNQPSAKSSTAGVRNQSSSSAPTLGIGPDHYTDNATWKGIWDRTFHTNRDSIGQSSHHLSPVLPPPKGRARAYSAQYFEIEGLPTDNSPVNKLTVEHDRFGAISTAIIDLFKLFRWLVVRLGTMVIDVLLGRHVGHSPKQVQQDKDIKHRLKVFRSIFLWQRPGLYYFAVEFSLLIQCFYIALWATNFVVIARDSYFPILWEIALVVPLPINFFLLKQIIYTSCMVKSIVQIDQRTANRITEQAIDERNVTQRLRRIIRDTMKQWDIPRKEWPARLQSYFELYADEEQSVDKENFKAFLHEIKIFITDESMKNLFKVIDIDRDHRISWYMLSHIVFPDHKKQKKIKLRKRQTSRGRIAYEYVVSEEAKKEMERRSSVLGMLTRVSSSTAEGAINVVRSNSLTRMSMLAMLGPQFQQQQHAPQDGASSSAALDRPVIASSSSPERNSKNAMDNTVQRNSKGLSNEAKVDSSTLPVHDNDSEEGGDEDEEEFDSNDSTSGDEEYEEEEDDDDEEEYQRNGAQHSDDDDHDHRHAASSDEQPYIGDRATALEQKDGRGGDKEQLPTYLQRVFSPHSHRPFAEDAAEPAAAPAAEPAVAAASRANATAAPDGGSTTDVITISSRLSKLRISARNLFDI